MKNLVLTIIFVVSLHVEAQSNIGAIDTTRASRQTTSSESPVQIEDLTRPNISSIRRDGKSFTKEENEQLIIRSKQIERSIRAGGDDVGNGGDELRQEFLALAQTILDESGSHSLQHALQSTLSIYRVIVVSNLSIQSGNELVPVRSTVAEGLIFLDAQAWDPSNGLLSNQHDPRYEILKLMNLAAGSVVKEEELVMAWNKQQRKQGKIWCPFYSTNVGSVRTKKEFMLKGLNASATEDALMNLCNGQGLIDCRVAKVITRGSGQYETTVTGFEVRVSKKSRSQLNEEKCEAARSCEIVYEWAPAGQVSLPDYSTLAQEVEKSCR